MKSDPILTSMYLPMVVMSATAMAMLARGLWRRIATGAFELKQHQILIAVILLFASDVLESAYWGVGRLINQSAFWHMAFITPVIIAQKFLILAAAIVSIDAWCRFRDINCCIECLIGGALGLWALSYMVLVTL